MTREQRDRPTHYKITKGHTNSWQENKGTDQLMAREQRDRPTHDKRTKGQINSWQENKGTDQHHLQVEQHLASKNHLRQAAGLPGLKQGYFNKVETSTVYCWLLGSGSLDHEESGVVARNLTKLRCRNPRDYLKVIVVVVASTILALNCVLAMYSRPLCQQWRYHHFLAP